MSYISFFQQGLALVANGFKSLRISIDGYSFSFFALLLFIGIMMIFVDMAKEA